MKSPLASSVFGAAGLVAIVLTGCSPQPGGDRMFPLAEGRRWTYAVQTRIEPDGPLRRESLELSNLGAQDTASGSAWRRRSNSGNEYWLRADDSGIYRVASRSPLDAEPVPDMVKRYVLPTPHAVGTQWEASTVSYLLARRNEVPREVRITHKAFPMKYGIAAVGQVVQAPAGRFEGCIKVEGRSEIRLYVDEAFQWRDIPIHTREWYCPDVGLVRLERSEPSPTRFMVGGTLTMELVAWQ